MSLQSQLTAFAQRVGTEFKTVKANQGGGAISLATSTQIGGVKLKASGTKGYWYEGGTAYPNVNDDNHYVGESYFGCVVDRQHDTTITVNETEVYAWTEEPTILNGYNVDERPCAVRLDSTSGKYYIQGTQLDYISTEIYHVKPVIAYPENTGYVLYDSVNSAYVIVDKLPTSSTSTETRWVAQDEPWQYDSDELPKILKVVCYGNPNIHYSVTIRDEGDFCCFSCRGIDVLFETRTLPKPKEDPMDEDEYIPAVKAFDPTPAGYLQFDGDDKAYVDLSSLIARIKALEEAANVNYANVMANSMN